MQAAKTKKEKNNMGNCRFNFILPVLLRNLEKLVLSCCTICVVSFSWFHSQYYHTHTKKNLISPSIDTKNIASDIFIDLIKAAGHNISAQKVRVKGNVANKPVLD